MSKDPKHITLTGAVVDGMEVGLDMHGEARDIFKDGPSQGLLAKWDEMEVLVEAFKMLVSDEERAAFVEHHPEIQDEVRCDHCGQWLRE